MYQLSQRIMNEVIGKLNLKVKRNYLDNIIIGLKTFEKYLKDLKSIYLVRKD
jgi:hypothetical protein